MSNYDGDFNGDPENNDTYCDTEEEEEKEYDDAVLDELIIEYIFNTLDVFHEYAKIQSIPLAENLNYGDLYNFVGNIMNKN